MHFFSEASDLHSVLKKTALRLARKYTAAVRGTITVKGEATKCTMIVDT